MSSLKKKSTPARSACAPAWCDRLLTTWYILFRRPCRAPGERPERRHAGDADRRPDGIGRQRLQVAVGKLRTGLIDRPRRQRQRVAERERLILLSRPADADGALSAPAPRELLDVTSYKL